jgi:hypothetical protein
MDCRVKPGNDAGEAMTLQERTEAKKKGKRNAGRRLQSPAVQLARPRILSGCARLSAFHRGSDGQAFARCARLRDESADL